MATLGKLLYSGRQNPITQLSDDHKAAVVTRILALTEEAPGMQPNGVSMLGRGGFIAEFDQEDPIKGILTGDKVIAVFEGIGTPPRYVRDPDSSVEEYLRKVFP